MIKYFIFLMSLLLLGCDSKKSPEGEVMNWYNQGQTLIESKDIAKITNLISADYSDQDGRDKAQLVRYLEQLLGQVSGVNIKSDVKELSVNDNQARIDSEIQFSNSFLRQSRTFSFVFLLTKENGQWYLTNSSYHLLNSQGRLP